MKRSEINEILAWAKKVLARYQIVLPPFGYWSPKAKNPACLPRVYREGGVFLFRQCYFLALALMEIFFALFSSTFGTVIESTPFFISASACSAFTSVGKVKLRWKDPEWDSL